MKVTEIRIKLVESSSDRLAAYCSVTFDHSFVVRDLKIIGTGAEAFVAMPSRRVTAPCEHCRLKNQLSARFCNHCGKPLKPPPSSRGMRQPGQRHHVDIAHPINRQFRQELQTAVLNAYQIELKRSQQPGYVSHYSEAYGPIPQDPNPAADADNLDRLDPPQKDLATGTHSPPGQPADRADNPDDKSRTNPGRQ